MIKFIFVLLALFSFLNAKIHLVVTYPIHKKLIEKIAKDDFVIHVVEDGNTSFAKKRNLHKNEIYYSNVYLTYGLEKEERYIKLFKNRNRYINIINLTKNIKKDIVNGKENPYVWMDPILVRKLSKNIFEELSKLKSYRKDFFKENYENFLMELDRLFLSLKKRLEKNEFYNIYVYEPYWHYFAKRFRLNLYYKENRYTNLDEVPQLVEFSKKHNIKKLLIKEESSYEQAQSLASNINADIIEHDITKYNWRVNLQSLVRKISKYKR
ncbi:hypothetical protein CP965_09985 [Halarcobacter mediterraneus]|uniref:Zinc ABC transporter substrate-binding protein n=1 Tax=Halarcobacter mediterraneus TaxID=2023153 RepID=A0A4Q1AVW4_9BACT|nr:zinc ABC transporter substrate-binding protein [Halarcobacter mediterraneus]RXK12102.1 hypothetical protein CP965_09985 [Halarcobacter mediterraneus]